MTKMPWPVVPIKFCSHLAGKKPSEITTPMLRRLSCGGMMHHCAARAVEAMIAGAKADGVKLTPTSSGDTYRDYEMQKRGFLQRYQLEDTGTGATKTFEGKTWYKKKGMATLATPGKSQHNLGLAVDVHSAGEPKRLNWLVANVKEFGFSWEVVPEEPWHLRYVCGDKIPATVAAYMQAKGIVAPTPKA